MKFQRKNVSCLDFFTFFSIIYWTKHVKFTLKSCLVSGFPFDYRCKTFTKLSNQSFRFLLAFLFFCKSLLVRFGLKRLYFHGRAISALVVGRAVNILLFNILFNFNLHEATYIYKMYFKMIVNTLLMYLEKFSSVVLSVLAPNEIPCLFWCIVLEVISLKDINSFSSKILYSKFY